MLTSLPNLVDNLSRICDNECKKCMEKKKKRLNCEFIEFENDRLKYKCKECKLSRYMSKNEAIKNFPIMHKFCNDDLNKLFLLLRKGVILMNTWIAGKNLMKLQYHLKNLFTAN